MIIQCELFEKDVYPKLNKKMYGLDSVNIVWLPRMGWSFPRVLYVSELATVVWINLYGIRLCTVFLLV